MNVTLTWDASPTANAYTVYRSEASGTQGPSIGTTTVTTLVDSVLTPGVSYFYSVTARNVAGESAPTAQVKVDVPNVPTAPTNLVATLGA